MAIDFTVRGLPKPGDLWKRPEIRNHGDDNAEPIFTAVGQALSQWEGAECAYAFIFSQFIFGGQMNSAERVYGSIISPGGRRDALNVSAEMFFHWRKVSSDDQADYKSLIVHHQKATALRNDIAHGMVFQIQGAGFYLLPAAYNSGKNKDFFIHASTLHKTGKKFDILDLRDYAYTAQDINGISMAFSKLRGAAHTYGFVLNSRYLASQIPELHVVSPQLKPPQ